MAAKVMLPNLQNYIFTKCFTSVIRLSLTSSNIAQQRCKYSTEAERGEETDETEAKRNVSRLSDTHYKRLEHVMKPPELVPDTYKFFPNSRKRSVGRQRRIFAKYGHSSGVDPGILWPSKEQLAEIIEDEKECEPTLQELWETARMKRKEEFDTMLEKEKKIDAALAKMPTNIQAYRRKLQKRGKEATDMRQKQRALLDEARDHFGYSIDTKDPRFKLMREAKVEEERKARKMQQKERKAKQFISSLEKSGETDTKK